MIFSPMFFGNMLLRLIFWKFILSVIYSVSDPSEWMSRHRELVHYQSILSFIQEKGSYLYNASPEVQDIQ